MHLIILTSVSELNVLCLTTLAALVSKILVSPCCLMLCSPRRTVRAATSLRVMLQVYGRQSCQRQKSKKNKKRK